MSASSRLTSHQQDEGRVALAPRAAHRLKREKSLRMRQVRIHEGDPRLRKIC